MSTAKHRPLRHKSTRSEINRLSFEGARSRYRQLVSCRGRTPVQLDSRTRQYTDPRPAAYCSSNGIGPDSGVWKALTVKSTAVFYDRSGKIRGIGDVPRWRESLAR